METQTTAKKETQSDTDVMKAWQDQASNSGDNDQNFKFDIKKIFEENISATTIHAINDIYKRKDYLFKTLITISFLLSGGICLYTIVNSLIEFHSYGVLTTTSVVSEVPAKCELFLKFYFLYFKS
jgi:hypothetical protein